MAAFLCRGRFRGARPACRSGGRRCDKSDGCFHRETEKVRHRASGSDVRGVSAAQAVISGEGREGAGQGRWRGEGLGGGAPIHPSLLHTCFFPASPSGQRLKAAVTPWTREEGHRWATLTQTFICAHTPGHTLDSPHVCVCVLLCVWRWEEPRG